ncbi:MAG: Eco57I restriction-modification methylase domain-containing protein [Lysobacter sp.]
MSPQHDAAKRAYQKIDRKRRKPWRGEEEVRLPWSAALEEATGLDFDAERSKRDLNYNNVIIEFKAPGLFNGSTKSPKFKEAMEKRLLPYIQKASKEQAIPEDDFIGIAIDGEHVCFAQVVGGSIRHNHLLPFSEQSVALVIEACNASFRRAITSDNLIKDFGHASQAGTAVMQVLADALGAALKDKAVGKVRMLFEEWRELYGQVADLSTDQQSSIDRSLRFVWNGPSSHSMAGRLFVIHTYNSLLIKLLAAEIVAAHGLTTSKAPCEAMAFMPHKALFEALARDIELGGLFSGAGIQGFVEEAIFSWHLDLGHDTRYQASLTRAIKALLTKIVLYRTDRLERQRDTLRDFYQGLVPQAMRKSLGEFYTPDWLVDFTVNKVAPEAWLGPRVLDPTCGSGSFLIEVIRRKRREAHAQGLSAEGALQAVCNEVWGFDLNPLAVQTARVNFLMEIADLLADAPGTDIELPVLLADAIYSPAPDPAGDAKEVVYEIGSRALTITLPPVLAFDRARLDAVFAAMGERVEQDDEFEVANRGMVAAKILTQKEAKEWKKPLRVTYDQVLKLHRKNWNGIWFRIVRNFFWSATAGKFDVIVGNPPWVRWSRLPEAYRNRVKPTCEQYDIFSKTKHHGGNELDISAMITYTTSDKWLVEGGRLAFVITQTVFQNPSSSGFRNFRINNSENLVPLMVDDLRMLKPFPDAANRTAVALFEKSARPPTFPIDYIVWDAREGHSRTIPPTLTLPEVMGQVDCTTLEANPVDEEGSPWAILPAGRFRAILPMSKSNAVTPWVEGRKGITTDLNGVYFVPVLKDNSANGTVQIKTRPEAGKKAIGVERSAWVEPDWLYPLIKGAGDFGPCYLSPRESLFAIVPNKGIRRADYVESEAHYRSSMPKLRKYFNSFDDLLSDRSTWKGRMKAGGAPNYTIYNVGDFTFKPWKVIWAEMSGAFSAAVAGMAEVPLVGKRPYVPDHKIFFVAFDDELEASYLCGLLNSHTVSEYVESHNVSIQIGDIFKHMRIPEYDRKNVSHKKLAAQVKESHQERDARKRGHIVKQVRDKADDIMTAWLQSFESIR